MAPSEMITRRSVEYKPTYQRFVLKEKCYAQQYSHIYMSRLLLLRDAVTRQIEEDATGMAVLPKIIDLRDGEECIVVGSLLKVLQGKPDLFKALTSDGGIQPIELVEKPLVTEDDQLILEDESGRVELTGDIEVTQMVTGVVLGVRGKLDATKNMFIVHKIYLPQLPPQHPLPEREESEYVALVSGLSIGRNNDTKPLRNHVLMDYLAGRIGEGEEQQFVAKIVRTIVVGNSIDVSVGNSVSVQSSSKKKSVEQLSLEATPLKNMDELLSSLACAMCVDVMPGHSDPSNYALPQQSFHPCLFPRSSRFASFRSVTNPYEAQIGGVYFYGHAGQPLNSLLQCTLPLSHDETMDEEEPKTDDEVTQALDCLQHCLEWRHVAPTAPDLLPCFPMVNEDPFIIETCPHVFFAGNQKTFSSRIIQGAKGQQVRLITVPSFAETSTIVLVDLKDLSCFPISVAL